MVTISCLSVVASIFYYAFCRIRFWSNHAEAMERVNRVVDTWEAFFAPYLPQIPDATPTQKAVHQSRLKARFALR